MSALEPREYSKRLGVLTPDQLQAALDHFGLGRLLGAEPAPGGLFGQNVFLTSSEGEFVLRGCPHTSWQFAQEAYFARLIAERTSVPAPWPYLSDDSPSIFGWSYAVMPRLPGLQIGGEAVRRSLSAEDKAGIARALGEGLARLHQPAFPFAGGWDHEAGRPAPHTRPFRQTILDSLEDWYDRCLKASTATTEADINWCLSVVEANAFALDVPFEPRIVHHDYKEGNAVASREDGRWRLSGVFDLMECYFGDPEEDFPRSVSDYEVRGRTRVFDFVEGYRSVAELRPGHRERFRIYMLRDCLLLWEYGQRNGIWYEPGQEFRPWAERFVELDPFDR